MVIRLVLSLWRKIRNEKHEINIDDSDSVLWPDGKLEALTQKKLMTIMIILMDNDDDTDKYKQLLFLKPILRKH